MSIDEAHNICDLMDRGELAMSRDTKVIVDAAIPHFARFDAMDEVSQRISRALMRVG